MIFAENWELKVQGGILFFLDRQAVSCYLKMFQASLAH